MPGFNQNIEIGRNCLSYYDEIIKISNISRTYIFQFQNRERKAFENEVAKYQNDKNNYESLENYKKKSKTKNLIGAAISFFLASILLCAFKIYWGAVLLVIVGVCSFLAYKESKRDTTYPMSPPQERPFPEKYGLRIEMNSGSSVYFTAVESAGLQALRKLQQDINNADTQQGVTIFNMNDNRVSVENNEGIVSTGEQAENKVVQKEKELVHL